MDKPTDPIIRTIQGTKVVLDLDLASVYGTTTKRLNEQVRRNRARFPSDFVFRLTRAKWRSINTNIKPTSQHTAPDVDTTNRPQIAASSQKHRSRMALPYAFTEHGALMAAQSYILKAPGGLAPPEPKFNSLPRSFRTFAPATRGRGGRLKLGSKLPPPDPPKKEIGFHVRESGERYSIRRKFSRRTIA